MSEFKYRCIVCGHNGRQHLLTEEQARSNGNFSDWYRREHPMEEMQEIPDTPFLRMIRREKRERALRIPKGI